MFAKTFLLRLFEGLLFACLMFKWKTWVCSVYSAIKIWRGFSGVASSYTKWTIVWCVFRCNFYLLIRPHIFYMRIHIRIYKRNIVLMRILCIRENVLLIIFVAIITNCNTRGCVYFLYYFYIRFTNKNIIFPIFTSYCTAKPQQ